MARQTTGTNGVLDIKLSGATVSIIDNNTGVSAGGSYTLSATKAGFTVIDVEGGASQLIEIEASPGIYTAQKFLFKGDASAKVTVFNDLTGDGEFNSGDLTNSTYYTWQKWNSFTSS